MIVDVIWKFLIVGAVAIISVVVVARYYQRARPHGADLARQIYMDYRSDWRYAFRSLRGSSQGLFAIVALLIHTIVSLIILWWQYKRSTMPGRVDLGVTGAVILAAVPVFWDVLLAALNLVNRLMDSNGI